MCSRPPPNCCARPARGWTRSPPPMAHAPSTTRCARWTSLTRAAGLGHGRGAPPGKRGHLSGTARRLQRRAARGQRVLHRHPAERRPVEQHQGLCRHARSRAADRRAAPLPAQDGGHLPPPRRRPGPRRQEAPGRDRRRADPDHHQVRRERPGFDQRLRTGPHRRRRPRRAAADRGRQPRARARSARASRAGASPCRRPTTSP